MLKSEPADAHSQSVQQFEKAAADALMAGVPLESLMTTLTDIDVRQLCLIEDDNEFVALGDELIYDVLPEGLIDLPSAVKKHGINRGTIRNWVLAGKIGTYGRLKGPAQGGGFLLLDEEELLTYKSTPRHPGGRPPKCS